MDAMPRNTNGSDAQDLEKTDSGYIAAIEELKKEAPEFLDDLTKEFKSFLLSGQVNIPQVVLHGAGAAGQHAPCPPLSRLFPHIDLSNADIIPENLCPACGERTFERGPNAKKWFCHNPGCGAEVSNVAWPYTRGAITLALLHFLNEKRVEFERLEEEGGDPQVNRANLIGKMMNGRTFTAVLKGKTSGNEEMQYRKRERKKAKEAKLEGKTYPLPTFDESKVASEGRPIRMMYFDGEFFPDCWHDRGTDPRTVRDTSSLMLLQWSLAPGKVDSPSPYDRMSSPAKIPQIGLFSDLDDISQNIALYQLLPHLAATEWLRRVAIQHAPPESGQPEVNGGDELPEFLQDYGHALITTAHRIHSFLPALAGDMGVEFDIDDRIDRIANDAQAIANFTGMPVAPIAEDLKRIYGKMSAMTEAGDITSPFQPHSELLKRVEQNLEPRFLLMKKIILAVSGMFGFGGKYEKDEDTCIDQRGGGEGNAKVKLHADRFSPATIAREFGLSQEVVVREMEQAVKEIVGYLVDLDASHDEISSPCETRGTRLVLQYLVPKPIIAAFLTENVERWQQWMASQESQKFQLRGDDPLAQASNFVDSLGRAVKRTKSDDDVQRRGGIDAIEKLRGEYSPTIPSDVFGVALEDLIEGAVTGATFRAFMAIEELGHDRIMALSKGTRR